MIFSFCINSDQPFELEEKYWEKINEYIEADVDEEYGNTSSASIPILLDELNKTGRFHKGQKIVLCGFGAGLTWGATLIEW